MRDFKQNRVSTGPPGLYVHVPFCLRKCAYCDFYSIPAEPGAVEAYLRCLGAELRLRSAELAGGARTVYVGGGTPTALGAEFLSNLLGLLGPFIRSAEEATVEANPGTVDARVAAALAEAGVGRVSLGAQSFCAEELRLLGRIHGPDEIAQAVAALRAVAVDNVSLDLIYAVPGQTLESWSASLDAALGLRPQHLSCYALSVEKHTPMERWVQSGQVAEMPEELQEQLYFHACRRLAEAGMEHYEISNFCLPGRRCRHNLIYWHNEPYVGVGPASAGCIDGWRWTNRANLGGWIEALSAGRLPPADREHLPAGEAIGEALMLGLRLIEGVDRDAFARRYGVDPATALPSAVGRHQELGSLEVSPTHLRIPGRCLFIADAVLADLLAEARGLSS